MSDELIRAVEAKFQKDDVPQIFPGDTLKVHLRITEGEKERIQVFQGVVIARRHGTGSVRSTFRVRKVSGGIGVERVFPLFSPLVAKIEVVRSGRVRRAKLYYLRGLSGKAARIRERRRV